MRYRYLCDHTSPPPFSFFMYKHLLPWETMRYALAFLLFASCTKLRGEHQCRSELYGYTADSMNAPDLSEVSFGSIEPYTTKVDSITRLIGRNCATQATFNGSDGCYYVFSQKSSPVDVVLCRITEKGNITEYLPVQEAGHGEYDGIAWSSKDEKLYGVKRLGRSFVLFEVLISGDSYEEHDLIPLEYSMFDRTMRFPVCMAIDNSGSIYVPYSGKVIKYDPETHTRTYRLVGKDIFAISHDGATDLFYGVVANGQDTYSFVSFDKEGKLTTIKELPFVVNREYHSAVFDACKGTYILSTRIGKNWRRSILFETNADGSDTKGKYTNALYQGLAVTY